MSSCGSVPLAIETPRCGLRVLVTVTLDALSLAGTAFVCAVLAGADFLWPFCADDFLDKVFTGGPFDALLVEVCLVDDLVFLGDIMVPSTSSSGGV